MCLNYKLDLNSVSISSLHLCYNFIDLIKNLFEYTLLLILKISSELCVPSSFNVFFFILSENYNLLTIKLKRGCFNNINRMYQEDVYTHTGNAVYLYILKTSVFMMFHKLQVELSTAVLIY